MAALLEVEHLSVSFDGEGRGRNVVDDICFSVKEGEILGVVGESGSGKSMTSLAVMGILPEHARVSGKIWFQGRELSAMTDEERNLLRGNGMGMVFQEPMTSLNPVLKVGRQVGESLVIHTDLPAAEIRKRTLAAVVSSNL